MHPLENKPLTSWGLLKNGNPRFNLRNAKQCGAKTRKGSPCKQPAMKCGRCKLHGGKATGPRTQKGKDRSKMNAVKKGYFSQQAKRDWAKLRKIKRAHLDVRKKREALLTLAHTQLCKILHEKIPANSEELKLATVIASDLQNVSIVCDEIWNPDFISSLNFLQKLAAFELLHEELIGFMKWTLVRRSICELKEIGRAEGDEAYFCKPLPSSVDPKYWKPCRM